MGNDCKVTKVDRRKQKLVHVQKETAGTWKSSKRCAEKEQALVCDILGPYSTLFEHETSKYAWGAVYEHLHEIKTLVGAYMSIYI